MRLSLFILLSILISLRLHAQERDEIGIVLSTLSGPSENVIQDSSVRRLMVQGRPVLPILAAKFTDSVRAAVFSSCANRYLTRGELAIIIADRIESMPYFKLTGLQNCMTESCTDNPNFVEFYLEYIRLRGMTSIFQRRYIQWLGSSEREKSIKLRGKG